MTLAGIARPAFSLMYAILCKVNEMMIRVATAILFALVLYRPVQADLPNSNGCDGPAEHLPASEVGVCRPYFPELESGAHDARNDRQAILRRIAVYLSVGNRDGAEILIAQLRSEGVSDEVVSDAINWTKLHGAPSAPHRTDPLMPGEVAW